MTPPSRTPLLLALGYALLLAYGTLYPFTDWSTPRYDVLDHLLTGGLAGSRTDILVNFLVYLPFGLLLFKGLPAGASAASRLTVVTIAGAVLSFALEYLQSYMPSRVPSLLDLILNTTSALCGGLLGRLLRRDTRIGTRLDAWRQHFFKPGPEGNLGLLVLAFWALSQLTPLVPSLDVGNLWDGIKPLWLTLTGQQPFAPIKALVYGLEVAAIALLLQRTLRHREGGRSRFYPIALALSAVLLLKVPVIGRSISLEALLGFTAGLLAVPLLGWARRLYRTYAAILFILAAQAIGALEAPTTPTFQTHAFSWIPFHGHLTNELVGFASILDAIWPFLALSLAIQLSYRQAPPRAAPVVGGILVFAFTFALEWLQQSIPGRFADITTALLALAAWLAPWTAASLDTTRGLQQMPVADRGHRTRPLVAASLFAAIAFAVGLATLGAGPAFVVETRIDQSKEPTHPAPEELPPLRLPGFRFAHPRLPAPTFADIDRLNRENPQYIKSLKKAARDGSGSLDAAITLAFIEPGSVDLTTLHRRLTGLKFEWRGHQEGKPLAVAYDWLYDQWSVQQRAELRRKLVEGGNYLIKLIRDDRLSPYNVYLYNSPFQALVAVSLALYADTPEGDPILRFTADFWKNRTLPVWRQIMGTNGGWHEGGEYVGIGIGQAVYQVPAMWRSATGEDLFATEPGIRGFLDFLVYRTRPDGTHFRWGDGAFHDRMVPDRIPLAIEYQDAAAYSLGGCTKRLEPTSWPWGPLPDDALCDPRAVELLPLVKFFDGIGMIVARNGWGEDATYLTFNAGDNYWSHTHLDQGGFTIYKGGALAIDSGLYGPSYGSDHHMNYTYQAIAHNVVTVTDPADTVPKPEKKDRPPRAIANDGGQRRIGSGWGVEAAPLDLAEWERKKDIYHTGSILGLLVDPDLTVAVADVAPAYTNTLSGKKTFSHRMRRVDAFVRTLGFDPDDDVVVIHDRVTATRPELAKQWLLHSIEEPRLDGNGFAIKVSPSVKPERLGGELHGTVLLPKNPELSLVGGDGFEFFVDGVNYDERGAVWEKVGKVPNLEPGSWRIVLSPPTAAREDRFLVVMTANVRNERTPVRVRLLEEGERYGCEIVGPKRTTRWWFDASHDGPLVEIVDSTGTRTRDRRVPKQPDIEAQASFWQRLWR